MFTLHPEDRLIVWLQFGDSQLAPKAKLPQIVQAIIRYEFNHVYALIWTGSCSSFASPESETAPNELILVGHNVQADLARLEEMKISE